jgi:DNA invertase Pin-like site-specific DNA recombinase
MLTRQLEGIAKAKSEGKYKGRAPTARAKTDQVLDLVRAGKTGDAVAEELGISVRSVWCILKENGARRVSSIEIGQTRQRTTAHARHAARAA